MLNRATAMIVLTCLSVTAASAQGTEPAPDDKAKIVAGDRARESAEVKAPTRKERKAIVEKREKRADKHVKIIAEPKARDVAE